MGQVVFPYPFYQNLQGERNKASQQQPEGPSFGMRIDGSVNEKFICVSAIGQEIIFYFTAESRRTQRFSFFFNLEKKRLKKNNDSFGMKLSCHPF